jgi:hypothetical protein
MHPEQAPRSAPSGILSDLAILTGGTVFTDELDMGRSCTITCILVLIYTNVVTSRELQEVACHLHLRPAHCAAYPLRHDVVKHSLQ